MIKCVDLLTDNGCPHRDDVRGRSTREGAEYMGIGLLQESTESS